MTPTDVGSTLPAPIVDIVVVGGGIAGLVTARDLHARGLAVRLVEAQSRLGGLMLTEHAAGMTIEAGPDSMLATKPSALHLCAELGLGHRLINTTAPRHAFVLRGGALYRLPSPSVLGLPVSLRAIAGCNVLSIRGRLRMARDFARLGIAVARPKGTFEREVGADQASTDQSIGQLVRRRIGQEAVRFLAQPLLGGIHAGDVDRLSVEALFPAIAAIDAKPGSLLRGLGRSRGRLEHGAFRSLAGGMGELVEALASALPRQALLTGTAVATLDAASPFVLTLSTGEQLRARAVVLAVPAGAAARLLAPIDRELAARCDEIPYASSATVTLAYRRASVWHPLRGTGFVVPSGESAARLLAVSWLTSKWEGRAPADVVMLRAFAGGALDPEPVDWPDATLVERAHADLAPLLGLSSRPTLARVYRWRDASPQYEVDHLHRVSAIEARLRQWPGLFLTGSGFRGVGIPDVVADARRTAQQVLAFLAGPPPSAS